MYNVLQGIQLWTEPFARSQNDQTGFFTSLFTVSDKWLSSVTDNWLETSSKYSVYVFSSSDDYCLPRQALPPQL